MDVIIYTTPTCVYCKMAKEYFKEHNVDYKEINVAEDAKAREELIQKSHQMGVPVIDIRGEIVVGFNKPELDRLLNVKT